MTISKAEVSLSLQLQASTKLKEAIDVNQQELVKTQQLLQNLRDRGIALAAQKALIDEIQTKADEYIAANKDAGDKSEPEVPASETIPVTA